MKSKNELVCLKKGRENNIDDNSSRKGLPFFLCIISFRFFSFSSFTKQESLSFNEDKQTRHKSQQTRQHATKTSDQTQFVQDFFVETPVFQQ